jgi:hypothetical protein
MGVCCIPAVWNYWKHEGLWPTYNINYRLYEPLQFEQIRHYFQCADPDAPNGTSQGPRLWHSKVDPILDHLRASSRTYQKPSSNASIDECMI